MITGQHMGEALMELMPETALVTGSPPSDSALDAEVRKILSEVGLDVDAAFVMGNAIVQMAVQAGQDPESTIVGAFTTGLALMAVLHRKGVLA